MMELLKFGFFESVKDKLAIEKGFAAFMNFRNKPPPSTMTGIAVYPWFFLRHELRSR